MGSRWQLLLPDAVKVWQGTELFISGDQRPATVKCRGRDQAISWIAMLKQGAAGENSNVRGDGQDIEPQSLKKTGEIFNSWHIIRKPKTTAFMQKGDLPKGNIGNGELAILPAFFKGCGSTPAEPRGSIGPEQGDVGVTDDLHRHSIRDQEWGSSRHPGKLDHEERAAIGVPPQRGHALARCAR